MPAQLNPLPAPSPKPGAAPEEPRRGRIFIYLGLIVLGLTILGVMRWQSTRSARPAAVVARVATAERGSVVRHMRVTGVTSARNFANVMAPTLRGPESRDLYILQLVPSGTMVKKGQVVATLDPQAIQDHLDDTRADFKDKANQMESHKAELKLEMENLLQNVRVAQANVNKARLDSRATEVRTAIDRELLRLQQEEAEAQFKELSEEVKLKQTAQSADMRATEIDYKIQQLHVERHENDLARLTIHAPMDGMVVIGNMWRPGGEQAQYDIGDRLRPGQPLMKIVDQSTMQVEGTVNQAESGTFRIGQGARVKLDAFPDAEYSAKVYSIGALATRGWRDQYFIRSLPVRVQMTQVDHRVIPDLSAAADIQLAKQENVIVVPEAAVRRDGNEAFVLVSVNQQFQKRAVKTGLSNGVQTAIVEGLDAGEKVRVD